MSNLQAIEGKPSAVNAEGKLDVGIILEQGEKTNCLRLQGSIDVSSAEELKKILVDAVKAGGEIRVLLGDATYLDVTAIQLLWAAEREASGAGVIWVFVDSLPEAIRTTLRDAGFDESLFAASASQTTGEIC